MRVPWDIKNNIAAILQTTEVVIVNLREVWDHWRIHSLLIIENMELNWICFVICASVDYIYFQEIR